MKPIPGFPGYFADSDGHIHGPRRKLRPCAMSSGHLQVVLGRSGGSQLVHRAVLLAYVGPPPIGMECLHRNGNPADNRPENLRWGTCSDNIRDLKHHGAPRKLTVGQVLEVKVALQQGGPRGFKTELAERYGVAACTITDIAQGRTHADL